MIGRRAALAALTSATVAWTQLAAQDATPARVVLRDSTGRVVPFAMVQAGGRNPRTADDSGVVLLRVPRADSLKLLARRIGFAAFEGWVRPDAAGTYQVQLNPLPQNLKRVTIYDRDTPLARSGFYDRMERAERGATVARFWTPEAIDLRNPHRTSVLMEGENIVRVKTIDGKAILQGRGGLCPMGLIVDGMRIANTVEDIMTSDGQEEIRRIMQRQRLSREQAERQFLAMHESIDELVSALSVVAVEIYSSMAGVPAELLRNAPQQACGLVVVWTGSRR